MIMGLRSEIREEAQERSRQAARRSIINKYYQDPDADMRGLVASMLNAKYNGDYEPSASAKRAMQLELELFDRTYEPDEYD